jgi:hypothetical protein
MIHTHGDNNSSKTICTTRHTDRQRRGKETERQRQIDRMNEMGFDVASTQKGCD